MLSFEPLKPDAEYESRPIRLLEVDDEGVPQVDPLNAEFDAAYLKDPRNPRWIAKPTVAYLWARTVTCKQCRATLPLLKTRWLCKKDRKRVLLTMEPTADQTGVVFGVQSDVPHNGGNAAQRREHDRSIGAGTMSRTGATCPCCGAITTMEDIRFEGRSGRLGAVMTAVVVDGPKGKGKEYRLPTDHERAVAEVTEEQLQVLYADIPFGLPEEQTPKAGIGASRAFSVDGYGFDTWRKLFTNRQLASYAVLISILRSIPKRTSSDDILPQHILGYLLCVFGKQLDYCNGLCSSSPIGGASGSWESMLKSVTRSIDTAIAMPNLVNQPTVSCSSAISISGQFDVVITDPPYYDAIPYSDSMDFFHVWLRRSTHGLSPEMDATFCEALGPKWNQDVGDGELIDDAGRFDGEQRAVQAEL